MTRACQQGLVTHQALLQHSQLVAVECAATVCTCRLYVLNFISLARVAQGGWNLMDQLVQHMQPAHKRQPAHCALVSSASDTALNGHSPKCLPCTLNPQSARCVTICPHLRSCGTTTTCHDISQHSHSCHILALQLRPNLPPASRTGDSSQQSTMTHCSGHASACRSWYTTYSRALSSVSLQHMLFMMWMIPL